MTIQEGDDWERRRGRRQDASVGMEEEGGMGLKAGGEQELVWWCSRETPPPAGRELTTLRGLQVNGRHQLPVRGLRLPDSLH